MPSQSPADDGISIFAHWMCAEKEMVKGDTLSVRNEGKRRLLSKPCQHSAEWPRAECSCVDLRMFSGAALCFGPSFSQALKIEEWVVERTIGEWILREKLVVVIFSRAFSLKRFAVLSGTWRNYFDQHEMVALMIGKLYNFTQ